MGESRDSYQRRVLDDELDELMTGLAAIAVEGPKGVGKTATASRRAGSAYWLDDPTQREIALADLDRLLVSPTPVLIDEWQNVPAVWDRVRRAVDRQAPPGSFLLTGSASPKDTGTHSGAGRIASVRMRPLSLAERWPGEAKISLTELLKGRRPAIAGETERRLGDYTEEILRSGLPGIRILPDRGRRAQLDSYLQRVVDRDFQELGYAVRNPEGLRRWLRAYAAATSSTASYEKIRAAALGVNEPPIARSTAIPYREALERLFQLDPVPAWSPTGHQLKKVSLPEKHQLADPALAARLLRVTADDLLLGKAPKTLTPKDGGLLGAFFESLVTLSVRVYAQAAEAEVNHFRTYRGDREVDLIVKGDSGRILAVEVKLAAAPVEDAGVHLNWLERELGDTLLDKVIITTGPSAYRRADGVAVVPAALLGP